VDGNFLHQYPCQPIYGYEDDNGNKVHDFEEMRREFEQRLSELESEVE
jgi:hypothetical protein